MTDFRYALNSSTIMTTPLLEKIRIASAAGYAGIEIWHSDVDAYVAGGGTVADIRKALDDHELRVPTTIFLKGWWDTVGAVYQAEMDEIRRRFEQARELGAPHAIAGPPLGRVDFEQGARQYATLLEVGREFGVLPVIEYLGFAADVNRIDSVISIMRACGDSDATTVLDPFHCFRGGGGVEAIVDLKPEQIAVSHFNDAPDFPPRELQHDPDRVMPGDGCMDLGRYCDLLRQIGYRGWLSLELFNREYWSHAPLDVARTGLEKMRAAAAPK